MKAYKRKRHIINNSRDSVRCNDQRKYLNSSERQRGRSIAVSELEEYEYNRSDEELHRLRWNLEIKLSHECYLKEVHSPEYKFSQTLIRLGLPVVNIPHKCDCPLPEKLSDEEILKLNGLI